MRSCNEVCDRVRQQISQTKEFLEVQMEIVAQVEVEEQQPIVPAETAEEFFFAGDRGNGDQHQSCEIPFFSQTIQCDRTFWGVLLGYTEENSLTETHIDAWIRKKLTDHRSAIFLSEQAHSMTRYAIMSTSFDDDFVDGNWGIHEGKARADYEPYISWGIADVVLIPLSCHLNNWKLIAWNIKGREIVVYTRFQQGVPQKYLDNLLNFYGNKLIRFRGQALNPLAKRQRPDRYFQPSLVYYEDLTQYPGSTCKSGLYLCMFMHNLITGQPKEVVKADVSDEDEVAFRYMMARELYSTRILN